VTFNDPVFKAFNDFRIDDMPEHADISRRMLRRLEDIDNSTTAGPASPAARAALATDIFVGFDCANIVVMSVLGGRLILVVVSVGWVSVVGEDCGQAGEQHIEAAVEFGGAVIGG
jgi:hypothetical protein